MNHSIPQLIFAWLKFVSSVSERAADAELGELGERAPHRAIWKHVERGRRLLGELLGARQRRGDR